MKWTIIVDEKWKYDNNIEKIGFTKHDEASKMIPKPTLTLSNIVFYVWHDCWGIVHNELPFNQTIIFDLSCQQIMGLMKAIQSIFKIILHHTCLWCPARNWLSLTGNIWCIQ